MDFCTTCFSYTEIFSITKDVSEVTYYAGNIDSNFFVAKRASNCSFEWTSSAGSATGDDDNDQNREIFYDTLIGSDGLIYAVGTTKGNFSSPQDEVPTLDAAIVVYDPSDGSLVRQAQYDVEGGLDDVARGIIQKSDGNLMVSVYASLSNVQNSPIYATRLLEISPNTLQLVGSYVVKVQTSGSFVSITGGPMILKMIYVESEEAVVAVGQILGRGLLFLFSLSTNTVIAQTEWGNIVGNTQIGGIVTDNNGAFFVTGSTSENVLDNGDLESVVPSEFHSYVIRYDNLLSAKPEITWVRQLAGSGSSQSGDGVAIDPVTGEIVVIGSFDADFVVKDDLSGSTFELQKITSDGLTDIFVWYLNAEGGAFTDLRVSFASSTSEDRGNVVEILSSRRLEIGGVINDGIDGNALACDEESVSASPALFPSVPSSISDTPTNPISGASPSPSSTLGLISVSPGTAISVTLVPNSSGAMASLFATSSISASTGPVVSPSGESGTSAAPTLSIASESPLTLVASKSVFASSSARSSGTVGFSSALPSLNTPISPSLSFGKVSTGPSLSTSAAPSTSDVMVVLISATPTRKPSPTNSDLATPSDSMDQSSIAPSSIVPTTPPILSLSPSDLLDKTPSAATASSTSSPSKNPSDVPRMFSATPSLSTSMETSTSPSRYPQRSLTTSTTSPSTIPRLSATFVDLASSSPTPTPLPRKDNIIEPSDVAEPVSEIATTSMSADPAVTEVLGGDVSSSSTPSSRPSGSILISPPTNSPTKAIGIVSATPSVSIAPVLQNPEIIVDVISATLSLTQSYSSESMEPTMFASQPVSTNPGQMPSGLISVLPEASASVTPLVMLTNSAEVTPSDYRSSTLPLSLDPRPKLLGTPGPNDETFSPESDAVPTEVSRTVPPLDADITTPLLSIQTSISTLSGMLSPELSQSANPQPTELAPLDLMTTPFRAEASSQPFILTSPNLQMTPGMESTVSGSPLGSKSPASTENDFPKPSESFALQPSELIYPQETKSDGTGARLTFSSIPPVTPVPFDVTQSEASQTWTPQQSMLQLPELEASPLSSTGALNKIAFETAEPTASGVYVPEVSRDAIQQPTEVVQPLERPPMPSGTIFIDPLTTQPSPFVVFSSELSQVITLHPSEVFLPLEMSSSPFEVAISTVATIEASEPIPSLHEVAQTETAQPMETILSIQTTPLISQEGSSAIVPSETIEFITPSVPLLDLSQAFSPIPSQLVVSTNPVSTPEASLLLLPELSQTFAPSPSQLVLTEESQSFTSPTYQSGSVPTLTPQQTWLQSLEANPMSSADVLPTASALETNAPTAAALLEPSLTITPQSSELGESFNPNPSPGSDIWSAPSDFKTLEPTSFEMPLSEVSPGPTLGPAEWATLSADVKPTFVVELHSLFPSEVIILIVTAIAPEVSQTVAPWPLEASRAIAEQETPLFTTNGMSSFSPVEPSTRVTHDAFLPEASDVFTPLLPKLSPTESKEFPSLDLDPLSSLSSTPFTTDAHFSSPRAITNLEASPLLSPALQSDEAGSLELKETTVITGEASSSFFPIEKSIRSTPDLLSPEASQNVAPSETGLVLTISQGVYFTDADNAASLPPVQTAELITSKEGSPEASSPVLRPVYSLPTDLLETPVHSADATDVPLSETNKDILSTSGVSSPGIRESFSLQPTEPVLKTPFEVPTYSADLAFTPAASELPLSLKTTTMPMLSIMPQELTSGIISTISSSPDGLQSIETSPVATVSPFLSISGSPTESVVNPDPSIPIATLEPSTASQPLRSVPFSQEFSALPEVSRSVLVPSKSPTPSLTLSMPMGSVAGVSASVFPILSVPPPPSPTISTQGDLSISFSISPTTSSQGSFTPPLISTSKSSSTPTSPISETQNDRASGIPSPSDKFSPTGTSIVMSATPVASKIPLSVTPSRTTSATTTPTPRFDVSDSITPSASWLVKPTSSESPSQSQSFGDSRSPSSETPSSTVTDSDAINRPSIIPDLETEVPIKTTFFTNTPSTSSQFRTSASPKSTATSTISSGATFTSASPSSTLQTRDSSQPTASSGSSPILDTDPSPFSEFPSASMVNLTGSATLSFSNIDVSSTPSQSPESSLPMGSGPAAFSTFPSASQTATWSQTGSAAPSSLAEVLSSSPYQTPSSLLSSLEISMFPGLASSSPGLTVSTISPTPSSSTIALTNSPSSRLNAVDPTPFMSTRLATFTPVVSAKPQSTFSFTGVPPASILPSIMSSESSSITPTSVILLGSLEASSSPELSIIVAIETLSLPSPTLYITGEPNPSLVSSELPWTPAFSPTVIPVPPCPDRPPVIPDSSLLARTDNFQRVRLGLQVAGPNLTKTCDLTDAIVQKFVNLSALSTLSRRHLWFVTSVEDGPPVYGNGSTLVVVEEEFNTSESTSPYPTILGTAKVEELFSGSVIFRVTTFLNPFSVELVLSAYIEYVESQNIVRALTRSGHNEIQWTGIISEPVIIDIRRAPDDAVPSGVSGGYVAGIAFGTILILGAAAFVVAEAGWPL
ncbi:unnamed protein product [Agarophyton chilense]